MPGAGENYHVFWEERAWRFGAGPFAGMRLLLFLAQAEGAAEPVEETAGLLGHVGLTLFLLCVPDGLLQQELLAVKGGLRGRRQ